MSYRIVVLISGNGSNLQAIIDADLPIEIAAVISNKADAFGLVRARKAGIPTHAIPHQNFESREAFGLALREQIDQYQPDLVVLAGFMRRLDDVFVHHFLGKMINIHPSLLPKYPGLNTHRRALEAGDKQHGISIHFVTTELDGGPVIAQSRCEIHRNDTENDLKTRVHELEHALYPAVIGWFAAGKVTLHQDQVELDGKLVS